MREVARAAAKYFKIDNAALYTQARDQRIAWPRQIAMTLCREMCDRSFPDIGQHFDGRDHTTVMHACKEVLSFAVTDDETCRALIAIAAISSGMAADRYRREQEWALALHAGQPVVELPQESVEAVAAVKKPRPALPMYPDRRIVVVNGTGRYGNRPVLLPSDLRQPTAAQKMARRA